MLQSAVVSRDCKEVRTLRQSTECTEMGASVNGSLNIFLDIQKRFTG